ncbi:zinc finger MYM-type protein 1-like [Sipha flava]|uniref:Zinc finger MYM-type protein 1-like n=1 Tax=Sipha flava TaxID=143950 RepID=A0A8B8GRQ9_9HEMI|nr:zinc finger MYM-type protein 1-like [Sipha flava]
MDIRHFFKKPRLENDEIENSFNNQSQPTEPAKNASPETNVSVSLPEIVHQHDIGLYVNKPATETIDLFPGLQILIWTPPENYKFPVSEKRNLKFQRSWLLKYKWLTYSAIMNGVFCKYCVLFSVGGGGIGHQTLGLLVKNPFTNWKKALESFSYHNSLEYYKTSLLKSNMRAEIDNQNILPVDLQISEQQLDFINESKKCLIPIIETLILCGRQGLAFRGSNDSGRITSEEPLTNDADETADIAGTEQVSICVRYLNYDDSKLKICEDFLSFVPVADLTGKGLSNIILDFLEQSGIDCAYLFGQGYDGASTMSGEFHGVQSYIREKYHLALYSHCAAHSFNLAVSAACSIPQIRNCLGTVQSIYNFFNTPKRQIALHDAIQNNDTLLQEKKKKLKKYCATSTWTDSKTTSGSFQLLSAIKTLQFQVSIHILHSVHALALSLSRVLQTENQDLVEAVKLVDAAKHQLEQRRQYSTDNFDKIFVTVEDICKKYNIPVTKPRLASRQTNRSNITTDSVADYYKITIYIPYHDLFITHLEDRFLKHRNILANFSCLFPIETKSLDKVAC